MAVGPLDLIIAARNYGCRYITASTRLQRTTFFQALLRKRGELTEAERLARRAVAVQEAALGPWHLGLARYLGTLADVLEDDGRAEDGAPMRARATAIRAHGAAAAPISISWQP